MTGPSLKAAPLILAAIIGAVIWTYAPWIGPAARMAVAHAELRAAEQSARDWRVAADGWRASFAAAEAHRGRETATAQGATASLIEQCAARVAGARHSARVIERIVTKEPTYDESRCPVRERIDAGQLREALAPGA